MDQSLFAAPHGLSQRTTSFIASQRQGIHQIPLRHLIALIIGAHPSQAGRGPTFRHRRRRCHEDLCFRTCPGWEAVKASHRHPLANAARPGASRDAPRQTPSSPGWSRPVGSVRTPGFACRASQGRSAGHIHSSRCLRTRLRQAAGRCASRQGRWRILGWRTRGGAERLGSDRTAAHATADAMVEQDGIEPTTSCLQSTRSPN